MESSKAGRKAWARGASILAVVVSALVLAAGCGLLDDAVGPDIISLQVNPSTISQNQAIGSTQVDVVLTIAGFEGTIVDADAFLQVGSADTRRAAKDDFSVEGDSTIRLEGIDATWFQGLAKGDYQVGASVVSDAGEDIERLDLATVTIE